MSGPSTGQWCGALALAALLHGAALVAFAIHDRPEPDKSPPAGQMTVGLGHGTADLQQPVTPSEPVPAAERPLAAALDPVTPDQAPLATPHERRGATPEMTPEAPQAPGDTAAGTPPVEQATVPETVRETTDPAPPEATAERAPAADVPELPEARPALPAAEADPESVPAPVRESTPETVPEALAQGSVPLPPTAADIRRAEPAPAMIPAPVPATSAARQPEHAPETRAPATPLEPVPETVAEVSPARAPSEAAVRPVDPETAAQPIPDLARAADASPPPGRQPETRIPEARLESVPEITAESPAPQPSSVTDVPPAEPASVPETSAAATPETPETALPRAAETDPARDAFSADPIRPGPQPDSAREAPPLEATTDTPLPTLTARAVPAPADSPGAGETEAATELLEDYLARLRIHLDGHKQYPEEVRRRRQQGTALVWLVIDRSGQVLDYRIEQSSGYTSLDREVREMIRRAEPFPAMPDGVDRPRLAIHIPVRFQLR